MNTLRLSYEFSDQNISTMLRDYDVKGLCAATRSVTGDYLTEEEQSNFFHLLCHFNKNYCAKPEKPIFNKTNDFNTRLYSVIYESRSTPVR